MAKVEQVLIIEPESELRFKGPFTGAPIASYIKLTNPTQNTVYYKIKTTAPKRYCVRPNSGLLRPNETCEIAVCLQSYDFDPNEKNKHKFMVQSIVASETDTIDTLMSDIWKNVSPDKLMDTKLKCVFENPGNNAVSNSVNKSKASATTAAKADSNSADNKKTGDAVKSSPKSNEDTEEKLTKASLEIEQLRVTESRLRSENLQLKEDVLKWRIAAQTKDTGHSSMSGLSSQGNNLLPMSTTSLVIAVAMVVVGYLMGKLI